MSNYKSETKTKNWECFYRRGGKVVTKSSTSFVQFLLAMYECSREHPDDNLLIVENDMGQGLQVKFSECGVITVELLGL